MKVTKEQIIAATQQWVQDVVIGCNFCPFAAKEFKNNTIRYVVETTVDLDVIGDVILEECELMLNDSGVETTLVILTGGFENFDEFMNLVYGVEDFLALNSLDQQFQVASFHPLYLFQDSEEGEDPANYTNRAPFPTLHILREDSVEKALLNFPNPELIPERNVQFATEKGLAYMKALSNLCLMKLYS